MFLSLSRSVCRVCRCERANNVVPNVNPITITDITATTTTHAHAPRSRAIVSVSEVASLYHINIISMGHTVTCGSGAVC